MSSRQLRDQFNQQRLKSLTEKLDIIPQVSNGARIETMSDIFNNFRMKSHSFGRNGFSDSVELDRSIRSIGQNCIQPLPLF